MSSALVTGATGFVGANLVAALGQRGWRVKVLLRASSSRKALEGLDYEALPGDVLDEASLSRAMPGIDCVFHVAAVANYWRTDVAHMYRVNVEGTRNVARAALKAGVGRMVHTSSAATLGVPEPGRPADERHAFNIPPEHFRYGHSKWLGEQEVLRAVEDGLAAVIVNPTVILGPRDVNFISGSLLREAARGWLKAVPPGGVNVVHVRDVALGHLGAAERGTAGERYILAGEDVPHRALAEMVCRTVGVPPPSITVPRAVLGPLAAALSVFERVAGPRLPANSEQIRLAGRYMYFDGSKARRAFDLPLTPARVAIEDAYHWYREHGLL